MNATLVKFGYPESLLMDFEHWCILLRPQQVTLGALILGSKHNAVSLGSLPPAAHCELYTCTSTIERAMKAFRPYDRINYIALMMVDPHVHFHVLPRYGSLQVFDGVAFPDEGWPAFPELKSAPSLGEQTQRNLYASLLDAFYQIV